MTSVLTQEELAAALADLEKQYGAYNLPDGIYHVTTDPEGRVYDDDAGNSAYIIVWEVKCGEQKGRRASTFLRWFRPDNPVKEKGTRGVTYSILRNTLSAVGATPEALRAIEELKAAPESSAAVAALASFAAAVAGRDLYLRLATREGQDRPNITVLNPEFERHQELMVCDCLARTTPTFPF